VEVPSGRSYIRLTPQPNVDWECLSTTPQSDVGVGILHFLSIFVANSEFFLAPECKTMHFFFYTW
jgi:hypothetical protein